MPVRKQILVTNEIYHIINRGVASVPIFNTKKDYSRFMKLVDYYSYFNVPLSFSAYLDLNYDARMKYLKKIKKEQKKIIEIYSYCLMPNHFHFLVKQLEDQGIKSTLSKVQNAYAKYVNIKYKRNGPLFQSRFKAKRIEKDEILLHVSRYIHLNPTTSFLVQTDKLESYVWSSYPKFVKSDKSGIVNINYILSLAGGLNNYKKFVLNQSDYQRNLRVLKHLLIE